MNVWSLIGIQNESTIKWDLELIIYFYLELV
jgi:hypothetical protein